MALLLVVATRSPGVAQLQVNAAARGQDFALIDVPDVPLQRVLLAQQRVVVWLPEPWRESRRLPKRRVFAGPDQELLLSIALFDRPPGIGLLNLVESFVEGMRDDGFLQETRSARQVTVAGRSAFELVARTQTPEGKPLATRLVIVLPSDSDSYHQVVVHSPPGQEDAADRLLKMVLRDWTPLERTHAGEDFEELRLSLASSRSDLPWAQRNRTLAAVARPEAIGQEWVGRQLEALAREDPVLVVDGLIHPHPRVRAACLAALFASPDPGVPSDKILGFTLRDPDAVVRYTSALVAAASRDVARTVLDTVLGVDSRFARSGAFQLLAVVDPISRGELVRSSFIDRDQYPASAQPLLASVLGEWGGAAEDLLLRAWKGTTNDGLGDAARWELVRRGHPQALAELRQRLESPLAEHPRSLTWAAKRLATYARRDPDPLRFGDLGLRLETTDRQHLTQAVSQELDATATLLRELTQYLSALPSHASPEVECEALAELQGSRPLSHWAHRRAGALSCQDGAPQTRIVKLTLREPGSLTQLLGDVSRRLALASPQDRRLLSFILASQMRRIADRVGDPLTRLSTGIDGTVPVVVEGWARSNDGARSRGLQGMSGVTTTVRLSGTDPDRFLDFLLRSSSELVSLDKILHPGLFLVAALPLYPTLLGLIWDERRGVAVGEDAVTELAPVERHVALVPDRGAGGGELFLLKEWVTYRRQPPRWKQAFVHVAGNQIRLSERRIVPGAARIEVPDVDAAAGAISLELDLPRQRELAEQSPVLGFFQGLVSQDLRLRATSTFSSAELATQFVLVGLGQERTRILKNAKPLDLVAPAELVPAKCVFWAGLSFDVLALRDELERRPEEWFPGAPRAFRRELLQLAEALHGEAGVAVLGVPAVDMSWSDRLVAYVAVDASVGRRFLKRVLGKSRMHGGLRVYRRGSLRAALVGDFLVFGASSGTVGELFREPGQAPGPMLDSTALYDALLSRASPQPALLAGLDVETLADALAESLNTVPDRGAQFWVELMRALGPMVASVSRREEGIVGAVNLRPRLLSEAARARARRLVGYVGYTAGSIRVSGFPRTLVTAAAGRDERIEITVELPEPGLGQWTEPRPHSRLRRVAVRPHVHRLISTAPEPLPATSAVSLPVADPELLPFLRAERNLDIRRQEIRDLAEEIRGEETDPARIVRAIAGWVHDHLEYVRVREEVSVEETLAKRQADCTEFTQLTIALCRAVGIPARGVSGISVGNDMAYLHRWAEVYLDRWYEIDSTFGVTQVPATSLRIPAGDDFALASMPGSRLSLEARIGSDGSRIQRLPGEVLGEDGQVTAIAVSDERVLVAYLVDEGHGPRHRFLFSDDRGDGFTLVDGESALDLVALLGRPGLLMRVERTVDGAALVSRFAGLAEGFEPLPVAPVLQAAARGAERWSFGAVPDGFLFLAARETTSRLFLLDSDFRLRSEVPLPEGGRGTWLVAADRPLLARRLQGVGVSLHHWTSAGTSAGSSAGSSAGWSTVTRYPDSHQLVPTRLLARASRIELVAANRHKGETEVLWWSPESSEQGRFKVDEAELPTVSVSAHGFEWALWSDEDGSYFSRRRLEVVRRTLRR